MKQLELFKERKEYYEFGIIAPLNMWMEDIPYYIEPINFIIEEELRKYIKQEENRNYFFKIKILAILFFILTVIYYWHKTNEKTFSF